MMMEEKKKKRNILKEQTYTNLNNIFIIYINKYVYSISFMKTWILK